MNEWIDIGGIGAIPRRGARCITASGVRIAVFRTLDDHVYALENRCAHKAGPLSEGIVHAASVTCPLHNWVYDLETGETLGADEGKVRTYPVRIVDGRIHIALDAVAVAAE